MNTIERIKERYEKTLGYLPSDWEIVSWYRNGEINLLSDAEENAILRLIETMQV